GRRRWIGTHDPSNWRRRRLWRTNLVIGQRESENCADRYGGNNGKCKSRQTHAAESLRCCPDFQAGRLGHGLFDSTEPKPQVESAPITDPPLNVHANTSDLVKCLNPDHCVAERVPRAPADLVFVSSINVLGASRANFAAWVTRHPRGNSDR